MADAFLVIKDGVGAPGLLAGDLTNNVFTPYHSDKAAEASLATIATNTGTGSTAAGQASSLTQETAAATALGVPADVAWISGSGSLVAILKGIFGKLAGTLTATLSGALPAGTNALGSVTIGAGTAVVGQVIQQPFALTGTTATTCNASPNNASQIVPFSATRKVLHLFNRSTGSETIDVGPTSAVAINGGIPIFAGGGGFTFYGQGASGPFFAISPVASTPISYAEG